MLLLARVHASRRSPSTRAAHHRTTFLNCGRTRCARQPVIQRGHRSANSRSSSSGTSSISLSSWCVHGRALLS